MKEKIPSSPLYSCKCLVVIFSPEREVTVSFRHSSFKTRLKERYKSGLFKTFNVLLNIRVDQMHKRDFLQGKQLIDNTMRRFEL